MLRETGSKAQLDENCSCFNETLVSTCLNVINDIAAAAVAAAMGACISGLASPASAPAAPPGGQKGDDCVDLSDIVVHPDTPDMTAWMESMGNERDTNDDEQDTSLAEQVSALRASPRVAEQGTTTTEQDTTTTEQGTTTTEQDTIPAERGTTRVEQDTTPVEQDTTSTEHDKTPVEQDTTTVEQDATPVEQDASISERDTVAVSEPVSVAVAADQITAVVSDNGAPVESIATANDSNLPQAVNGCSELAKTAATSLPARPETTVSSACNRSNGDRTTANNAKNASEPPNSDNATLQDRLVQSEAAAVQTAERLLAKMSKLKLFNVVLKLQKNMAALQLQMSTMQDGLRVATHTLEDIVEYVIEDNDE